MRINKFIASATGLSRRVADKAVEQGNVLVNGTLATSGQSVADQDEVKLNGKVIKPPAQTQTIMLNKPAGYVVSRDGQGSKTIYELLPPDLHHLKPIGRLDKDSSGLLLLTNDGQLAQELTHPKYQKTKIYEVTIDKPLSEKDFKQITKIGVDIDGFTSKLQLQQLATSNQELAEHSLIPSSYFLVTLKEGKNRQIRRTFAALGYNVTVLHRTHFGSFTLDSTAPGGYKSAYDA